MTREDWLFVGIKLMGIYWIIVGITSLPQALRLSSVMNQIQDDGGSALTWLGLALQVLIGGALIYFSPRLSSGIARRGASPGAGQADDAPDRP